jgi:RHS repeat-associated protein
MANQTVAPASTSSDAKEVFVYVDNAVASEADGYMDFVVTLSAPSDQLVSVNYVTENDTASSSSNTDFSFVSGTLRFEPGVTSQTVRVPVTNNALAESTESFFLNLSSPTNAVLGNTSAVGTIFDNDTISATPAISISDAAVDETAGTATFVVTLDKASASPVSVRYASADGTAQAGSDYIASSGVLDFAPGQTVRTIELSIADDALAEGVELFNMVLSDPAGGAVLGRSAATGRIAASDAPAAATPIVSVDNAVASEADGFVEFVVTLSAPSDQMVSVNYVTENDTASSGSNTDFSFVSGTLRFEPGVTSQTVRVPVTNNALAESTESFFLNLSNPINAVLGNTSAVGTIFDNDTISATPAISISDAAVDETAGTATFVVTLDKASASPVSVRYASADGTAQAGSDYIASSGVLDFAPGQTVRTIELSIADDALAEGVELFNMVLSDPAGGAVLGRSAATGRIAASDAPVAATPIVSVGNAVASEADGYMDFVVTLSAPSDQLVSVNYVTENDTASSSSNTDFSSVSGTLRFEPGVTSQTVRVPVTNNALAESTESFFLNLSSPTNAVLGNTSAVGTIFDNDTISATPAISISDAAVDETAGTATFVVTLDKASASPVSVRYASADGTAQAGSDYIASSGVLDFAPGQTVRTIELSIADDALAEGVELFNMVLSDPAGGAVLGRSAATGRIAASDAPVAATPIVSVGNAVASEADGYMDFVVTLSAPSDQLVSVNYVTENDTASSSSNTDFSFVSGTLRFEPGVTSQTVRVPVTNNALAESTESFFLNLSAPTNATLGTARASGTILDNDSSSGQLTTSLDAGANMVLAEGANFLRSVRFSDSIDNGDPGWSYSVDYGDGTPVVTGHTLTPTLTLSHKYEDGAATYAVVVSVTDVAGDSASDAFTVTVNNVAPKIALSGASSTGPGNSYSLNLGAITDPGTDSVSEYRIDWGDGSPIQTVAASALPSDGVLTHAYTSDGRKTITVALVDDDGVHLNAGSQRVTVRDQPLFEGELALPDSLAPGEEGMASFRYANVSSGDQAGVLVLVESTAGLLRDPLTGVYADKLLLIGRGDGEGAIVSGESGVLEFAVRMANAPRSQASVNVSIIDAGTAMDWPELAAALRPAFMQDAAWQRILANFESETGGTTAGLLSVLADNSALIDELGLADSSAMAAWAFELEQAGDFGSIAERATPGSLGDGWAFIGDVRLDIGADGDIAWRGSTDLGALFSLDPSSAARYTVSSSAGVSVALNGGVLGAAAADRPVFVRSIDGSYATDSAFGGTLVKTADGYEVRGDNSARLRFDSDGRLQTVMSSTGREVQVTYDAEGRITGFAGDFNNVLTIVRDTTGRAVELVDEYGNSTALSYDGDLLAQVTGSAGTTVFGYNGTGDLASTTPPGGPAISFDYDSQGRLAGIDLAGANVATIAYDSRGGYTWTSAEGQQSVVQLAPGGLATEVSVGGGSASELVFDASGKLAGVQLADGTQVQFGVDDQGRLTSITDPNGATVRYAYSDDSTRPTSFTDAGGTTRQFSYDENGRMIAATWADGSSLQFSYDAQGQITGYSNRRGDAATYDYDANGQLLSRTEADGATVYSYDAQGRVIVATTQAGTAEAGTTRIGYDSASRVTRIEYPDGRSLEYTYDVAGRRTSMTDHDGNVQTYGYDAAGRLSTVSYNGSQIVAYDYDADGRLIKEANGNGTTTTYSYDTRGQLTAIVNLAVEGTESSAYRYSYDVAGQRVGMQTPHGDWVYGYDASGQLTSAQFSVNSTGVAAGLGDKSLIYAYDAAGNRTSVTEDGVQTLYTSNALNQYTRVGDTTYTYDADGNQISKTVGEETWTYRYNEDNRLERITAADGVVTQYEYDVFGNRSAAMEEGVRTEFLVDPFALGVGSPVAEYSGGERVATYLYGLNAIAQQTRSGMYYFEGDAVKSVTGVTSSDGTLANIYVYDPFGRRVLNTESVVNRLEFNGLLGVEKTDLGLSFMRARFYDSEQGRFTSEDPLWINGDTGNLSRFALNNPVSYVDPSGQAIWIPILIVGGVGIAATAILDIPISGNIASQSLGWLSKLTEPMRKEIDKAFGQLNGALGGSTSTLSKSISDKFNKAFQDVSNDISSSIDSIGKAIASIFGDPHFRTFDGLSFDFQAAGEFILALGTGLEIQTRQEPWGNSTSVSVNTAVAMRLGDAVVGLYTDRAGNPLNINGEWVHLDSGETISVGGGSIYRNGSVYIVISAEGDGFWANVRSSHIDLRAFIHEDRGSDLAGLLGNNDGIRGNDLAMADGTVLPTPVPVTQLYGVYADSWRVTDATSLLVYGDGESTATFTNRHFPIGITTLDDLDPALRAAAERIARDGGLTEGTWEFDSAVLDIALTMEADFAEGVTETPGDEQPTPIQLQNPPVLIADTAATQEDTPVSIDVLANDSDPEGDVLTIVSASDAHGGTVDIVNGALRFLPAKNFNGSTELSYAVSDGAGNVVTGKVDVTVSAVNDRPELVADQYTTTRGQQLIIPAAAGLLANDFDPEGDPLTVTGHGLAAHGVVEIEADGSLRYTPNAGYIGTDTIEYTVSDGEFEVGGSLTISVINVPPSLTLGGQDAIDEGGSYRLSIVGGDGDTDGAALTYVIDWGDGSAVQTLAAAELAERGGEVIHVFADDDDGPTNMSVRNISVTVSDGDGGSTSQSRALAVRNVAPAVALSGEAVVGEGNAYMLELGPLSDPGTDTASLYSLDWGDGTVDTFTVAEFAALAGRAQHVYAADGQYSIVLTVTDEDGSFIAGSKGVGVLPPPELMRVGDAPTRVSSGSPNAIASAWLGEHIASIAHKSDADSPAEAWSAVSFNGSSATVLAGVDHYAGDLGVSGQSAATSSVRQEIDGREVLRFNLEQSANKVTVDLSRFYVSDDGTLHAESGRLRLLDVDGAVVGETTFVATSASGERTVSLDSSIGFSAIELTAGTYDGDSFIFGAYADESGRFAAGVHADVAGKLHGSDFLVDWVEFEFQPVGTLSPVAQPDHFVV